MERLADTELQMALELSGEHSTMRRIAEECIAHRASLRADAELVKAVVREAIHDTIGGPIAEVFGSAKILADDVHGIATRVAEQLASAAPVLSKEERGHLEWLRSLLGPHNPQAVAAAAVLDRLLGAAP